ncbi:MAG: delta-aminolevulinic acid dehydratase [Xenococcaceae cyanobacterium MO_167.B27]|nr:delta-aminolevulinic acid dehydratase [Xenococcaceae cyanobacterium MO_167.B27]
MTLINTQQFHALANAIGTILFIFTVLWAFWFASRMD